MSEFKDAMMTHLEEFKNATAPVAAPAAPRKKAVIEYKCDVSGIDMTISRTTNGKCTKMLFIYLSQLDANNRGTMFIKNMKDGTMVDADDDALNMFFRDLQGSSQTTGSNAIPVITSGKEFAYALYRARDKVFIDLIKEGILNVSMLYGEHGVPWYAVNERFYRSTYGIGIEDKHAKLIRYAATVLSERYNCEYSEALSAMCLNWGGHSFTYVWAFSALADIFDEPFAIKCFDEYIDNERLATLTANALRAFFDELTNTERNRGYYYARKDWGEIVSNYKSGKTIVNLDKNRFWEYLQHAIAVGMGKRLDDYLQLWRDYLSQSYDCDGKIKDKYPDCIQVAHDLYSEKYTTIKEFRDNERLKARVDVGTPLIDQVHGGYQLKVLRNAGEFLEEAYQNCNCVASYVERVAAGRCWVASFRKVGDDVTQLTVEIDPEGRMVQIKGKYNRPPTEKEKDLLKPFKEGILKRMEKAIA